MLLEKSAYDFAQRILENFQTEKNINDDNKNSENKIDQTEILKQSPLLNNPDFLPMKLTKDDKRIIGSTNYKKFEDIAKQIEREDELAELKKKQKNQEDHEKKRIIKNGM